MRIGRKACVRGEGVVCFESQCTVPIPGALHGLDFIVFNHGENGSWAEKWLLFSQRRSQKTPPFYRGSASGSDRCLRNYCRMRT